MLCACKRVPFAKSVLRRAAAASAARQKASDADLTNAARMAGRTVPEGCVRALRVRCAPTAPAAWHPTRRIASVKTPALFPCADVSSAAPLCSYTVLREGKGEVLQRENDVFYNKAQARVVAR